jgi:3-oxoacyl-[acyl-carrier protein] reductase
VELKGRAALVTGASGSLGSAISRVLAEAGCDVAVGYVGNREGADETVGAVEKAGRKACRVQVDQTQPAMIEPSVERVVRELGRLDILVNNAAWNIGVPFPDLDGLTTEIWDRMMATNVRGPFEVARAAVPHMRAQGAGRIVNIASVSGLKPGGSSIAYASSKAALIHLTRCLAITLAPAITVNCVAPGLVEGTRMALRIPPEAAERVRREAVLQRASDATDIANQVVTFCRADSVTGQVAVIDGGYFFH